MIFHKWGRNGQLNLLLVPFGADFIYLLSKGMVHDLMIYAFFFCAVLPISLADRLQPLAGKAIRLAVPLAGSPVRR